MSLFAFFTLIILYKTEAVKSTKYDIHKWCIKLNAINTFCTILFNHITGITSPLESDLYTVIRRFVIREAQDPKDLLEVPGSL